MYTCQSVPLQPPVGYILGIDLYTYQEDLDENRHT